MTSPGLGLSKFRVGLKLVLKHLLAPLGLVFRQSTGQRVLFYHRVNDHDFAALGMVSRELSVPIYRFAQQMAWLAGHGFRTLQLDEFQRIMTGQAPADPKAVLITFDDGYADNLEHAAPVLAAHGFRAVVYPPSDLIGQDNSVWPMSDPEGLGQFMDKAGLTAWQDAGGEIGSHSCTHPVLTHLDDAVLNDELTRSRQTLRDMFDIPCKTLAYPGGDVDARVADAARAAGYELGFTTRSGRNPIGTDLLLLRRTEVSVSDTNLIFMLKMRGFFDWLGVRDTPAYRNLMRLLTKILSRAAGVRHADAK